MNFGFIGWGPLSQPGEQALPEVLGAIWHIFGVCARAEVALLEPDIMPVCIGHFGVCVRGFLAVCRYNSSSREQI